MLNQAAKWLHLYYDTYNADLMKVARKYAEQFRRKADWYLNKYQ